MSNFGSLAAGAFRGQDLAAQLLAKQQANQQRAAAMAQQQKQQQAMAMLGEALQKAGLPPQAIQQVMTQGAQGGQPQGVPQGQPPGAMPQGAPQGQPPAQGAPGAGAPPIQQAQGLPQAQQGSAMGAVEGGEQNTWAPVLDYLRKRTGADPETLAYAVMDAMPEVDKEEKRQFDTWSKKATLDQKNYQLIETLKWRYEHETDEMEKARIGNEIKERVAQIGADSREKVAATNVTGRENVAETNVAGRAADTDKKIGADIYKAELTSLAKIRSSDDVKRGQDLAHADRQAAEAGRATRSTAGIQYKFDTARSKAANAVDAALTGSDQLAKDAEDLLNDPNLDKSVGNVVAHMPGVLSQDVQNFRDKLGSFRAEKMMAVISNMRAAAGNGSTGFGRITNFEAQQIQNSIASLADTQDPQQFRAALVKLIGVVTTAKAHVAQAYEQQYGGTQVPAAGPNSPAVTKAEPAPTDQSKLVKGKSYSSPDGKIGIWNGKTFQLVEPQ